MADKETTKTKKASKRGKSTSSGKLPYKTSINLLIEESHTREYTFEIFLFLIFMVGLGFFTKFMVIDQIAETDRLAAKYQQTQSELEELQNQNSIYEQVRAEYSHYGNSYLNDEESNEQDRLAVLKVIEEQLLEQDALQSIEISGNVAQLIINSEKLRNVSEIVAALEDEKIVEYVTVSTSQSDRPSAIPAELQAEEESEEEETEESENGTEVEISDGSTEAETEDPNAANTTGTEAEEEEESEEDQTLAMAPEKSVVTTMTIYFKSVSALEAEAAAAANNTANNTANGTGAANSVPANTAGTAGGGH